MPLKELYNLYGFDNPFDTIQALMLVLTLSWQTTELLWFVIDCTEVWNGRGSLQKLHASK